MMTDIKREASVGLSLQMQGKEGDVEKRLSISVPAKNGEKLDPQREGSGGRF